ncbi:hypothetical protein HDU87_006599 [Geranomyces variabilis]|uniref:Uncharacterized protein n=1 Tax=Geranomyces variabilis TaxID=109894 RepID=A0AAD5XKY0_9FUNG|nr:hypothetical protein HDU87_006599 [Geranomyces variabilis]
MRASSLLIATLAVVAGVHGRAVASVPAAALQSQAPSAEPSGTVAQPTHAPNVPPPAHPAATHPANLADPPATTPASGDSGDEARRLHHWRPNGDRNPDHQAGHASSFAAPADVPPVIPPVRNDDEPNSFSQPAAAAPAVPAAAAPEAAPAAAPAPVAAPPTTVSTAAVAQPQIIQPAVVEQPAAAADPAPAAAPATVASPAQESRPAPAVAPQVAPASSKKSSVVLAPVASAVGVVCVVGLVAAGLIVRKRRAAGSKPGGLPYTGSAGSKGFGGEMSDPSMHRVLSGAFPAAYHNEQMPSRDVDMENPPLSLPRIPARAVGAGAGAFAAAAADDDYDYLAIERAVTDVFQRHQSGPMPELQHIQPIPVEQGWHEQANIAPYLTAQTVAVGRGDSLYSDYASMPPSEAEVLPVERAASPMTTNLALPVSEEAQNAAQDEDLSFRDSFASTSSIGSYYRASVASSILPPDDSLSINTFGKSRAADAADAVKHSTLMNALNHIGSNAPGAAGAGGHGYWSDDDDDEDANSETESQSTIRPSKHAAYDTGTLHSHATSDGQSFVTADESIHTRD